MQLINEDDLSGLIPEKANAITVAALVNSIYLLRDAKLLMKLKTAEDALQKIYGRIKIEDYRVQYELVQTARDALKVLREK